MNIHRCRFVDYNASSITFICFSHDSSLNTTPKSLRCAVGRANGDLEIWNPQEHWTHEITFRGGINRSIEGISWVTTQKSSRLFTIGYSTFITEWNLEKLIPLNHLDVNSGAIWSISVSPSKDKLAVGCDNGNVAIVNISGGKGIMEHLYILACQNSKILSLSWDQTFHIIAGCSDSSIRIWDSCSSHGSIIARMSVDKIGKDDTLVWTIEVLKSGVIVTGDSTGSVKFWDQKYYTLLQSFKTHTADILCLASNKAGDILFSTGVDRKTVLYRVVNKETQQWADLASRKFHKHDVRAMALYESKDIDILVTGGVDMALTIIPVIKFMTQAHRTIQPVPQKPIMSFSTSRIMINWSDHQVKLWRINEIHLNSNNDIILSESIKKKHLLLKMRINTEENINVATISKDGNYIAVGTLCTVKLFKLNYDPNSCIKVKKLQIRGLDSIGATVLLFDQARSNLIIAYLDKVYFLNLQLLKCIATITKPEKEKMDIIEYSNVIKLIALSTDSKYFATYSFSHDIYIYDLESFVMTSHLPRLSSSVVVISFCSFISSLIVVTIDNLIFDFNIKTGKLGDWSKKNSADLPTELLRLKDNCIGVSFDCGIESRMWLWGSSWIGFIDLSVEMLKKKVNKRKLENENKLFQPIHQISSKERIIVQPAFWNEKKCYIKSSDIITLKTIEESMDVENKGKRMHFWITYRYRSLLLVGCLNKNELLIVERPLIDMLIDKGIPPPYYKHLYGT
ncbi:uncharacterized protein T551_03663 [Pneumocystis jirovecii RU7]|uniref:Uncharacterized protein n=1 Tax=Pneumocystis jirovecii (strain RU7) TaxID=1408657 RepID=A0A0W4ZBX2_PNEJ7|nr:uncharacterized protein T551_03663 [Pneumocystis jirovecii RU7]KTW25827.1 hypothetical protein T551_03663 [Pneumocystis jirovecii RU7]